MKNLKKKAIISLLLSPILIVNHVLAANQTANFQASSTIQASCSLTVTNLNFGLLDANNTSKTITGNWSATCSNGLPYVMSIPPGSSGDATARTMSNNVVGNTDKLIYIIADSIFLNPVIGDTNDGNIHTISATGTGLKQDNTFYGLLRGAQYVTPGAYSETLTMILTF